MGTTTGPNAGTEYRPAHDNGDTQYILRADNHWIVRSRDGVTSTFAAGIVSSGSVVGTTKTYSWNLVRSADRNGNLIEYTYSSVGGGAYVGGDELEWTGTLRLDGIYYASIVGNLMGLARGNGSTVLTIEGTLANDRLMSAINARPGWSMVTVGSRDFVTIQLVR